MMWLVSFMLLCLAAWVARRRWPGVDRWFGGLLEPPPEEDQASKRPWGWLALGLVVLGLAFTILEVNQPYYFTQDDALVTELPGMLYGCRALWRGEFPDYSPNCLLGGPVASSGGGSLTYPPTWLAYAIARYGLHDEYALLEVFAALHLLAGFLLMWWLARRLRLSPMAATLASLALVLSGGVLIMGRCWHMILPTVVAGPAIALCLLWLKEKPIGWRWALVTGLVLGVYYQVGFPQEWAYAALFFGLGVLWLVLWEEITWRRALWSLPALTWAAALAAPLLWCQMSFARNMVRPPSYGRGILPGLAALFLPAPLVHCPHPNFWGSTDLRYMSEFYYFGTILAVTFVLGLVAWLTSRWRRDWGQRRLWFFLAVVAFLLALGEQGGLWQILSHLPFLSLVNNNPFRALPFMVLFVALAGGAVLDRLLRPLTPRRWAPLAVGLLGCSLLLYHASIARPAFYSYGFKPYPALPPPLAKALDAGSPPQGRLIPIAPMRSLLPGYGLSMMHGLPVVYGLYSFFGYDPLVQSLPPFRLAYDRLRQDTPAALKAYGVRYLVLNEAAVHPLFSPNPVERGMEGISALRPVLLYLPRLDVASHTVASPDDVWTLKGADPLAFPTGDPGHSLPIRFPSRGINVALNGMGPGPVTVNFLWYRQMHATADGQAVPCHPDQWGRIQVELSKPARNLAIRFDPGWLKGLLNGGLLALLGLLLTAWFNRRLRESSGGASLARGAGAG